MTTLPTPRPPQAPAARPASGPLGSGASIDPVKLLKKYKWLLSAAAILGGVLGVAAHYVLLNVYPIWTANVTYRVLAQQADVRGSLIMDSKTELERTMATQVSIMLSDRIIERAVNNPDMAREAPKFIERHTVGGVLDTAEAIRALKRRTGAGRLGETEFVRLSVWDNEADTATALAKVLSDTYMDVQRTGFRDDQTQKVGRMRDAIGENARKIEELKNTRKRLLQDQSVDTLDSNSTEARQRMGNLQEMLMKSAYERSMLQVRLDQMEEKLRSPAGLTYDDTIRSRVQQRPELYQSESELMRLEAALADLKTRLGATHRSVRALDARVEGQRSAMNQLRERLLREEFDGQMEAFRQQVEGAKATEADLMRRIEEAATRATELSQAIAQVKDLDREIDGLQATVSKFQEAQSETDVLTGSGRQSRVGIFQDAQRPRQPTFPKLSLMLPLGILLVTGLVAGLVLLLELLDQRVKTPADVAMIPRTRLVGQIPHASEDPNAPQRVETVFRDQPRGVMAESFRQVRSLVGKRMATGNHKSLLVMSGLPGSGATSVAINLAHAFAAAEQRVLLVDANLRRPSVHKALGAQESPGLADVLAGEATLETAAQNTDHEHVDVLPAGSASLRVYERLGGPSMGEFLEAAGKRYDIVVLDVAPAVVAGDALALANRVDATLLVVKAMSEKRGMVARLRNDLSESKSEFMGVLVNAIRSAAGGYLKSNIQATHEYQRNGESSKS